MWRRAPCLRPQHFLVQKAWKSTRRSAKHPKPSPLFEAAPIRPLPRPTTPLVRLSEPTLPLIGRIKVILIAFAAGFSIVFFLEDPESGITPAERPAVSPGHYVQTKLTSTETSGPDTKLLKIAAPPHIKHSDDASIWSLYIKDDDIQVERAYTPLNGVDSNGDMLFWIKKYPKGEVGRWLHSKMAGDKIEVRGPIKTWQWKDGAWDEVVMISGGTGITPFVQLFNNVISHSSSEMHTRFTLIHSSRVPGELPPATILEPMVTFSKSNSDKFKLHIFVDEKDGSSPSLPISDINTGRINEEAVKRCLVGSEREEGQPYLKKSSTPQPSQDKSNRRILFLVCGPEPMIGAIAGPYGRNFSQGPIGGILGKLGYTSNEVYKL